MENYKEILDNLLNNEDSAVRRAVAEQGYGLEKLVNDESWLVRKAVANQGYGLDKLVDDEDYSVRMAVANQGYGLDKLVDDEDGRVRSAVAKQGYGLDKLVNDEVEFVRKAAKLVIESERETIQIIKNNTKPFEFASKILSMDLETQNEIFPEVGSTENIFKYFTFEEALERYNNWHKDSIEGKDADE